MLRNTRVARYPKIFTAFRVIASYPIAHPLWSDPPRQNQVVLYLPYLFSWRLEVPMIGLAKGRSLEVKPPKPNFMQSLWHLVPVVYTSTPLHRFVYWLSPKGLQCIREGKIPVLTEWEQIRYVLPKAMIPVLVQYISVILFNFTWPAWLAFGIYTSSLAMFLLLHLRRLNSMGEKYGYLDGRISRDKIPDYRFLFTAIIALLSPFSRLLLACFVAYDPTETPYLSPWLLLHVFIYTVVTDFWFYVYHRAMHEIDFLWKFHKLHHMTKHPNVLLTVFGSLEQDFFDIIGIPTMAYLTYPVNFHTWWICSVFIVFKEASGHSGVRIQARGPICSPILKYFDMDINIEDHDLHHRYGWRKSFNYGKQTRMWDKIFGTTRPRIETVEENVDWSSQIKFSEL